MQEAYEACHRDLTALHGFLMQEETVLIGGVMDEVEQVFEERVRYLGFMDEMAARYTPLLATSPITEEEQAALEAIRLLLGAIAYQNQVNQQILTLRQDNVRKQVNMIWGHFPACYDAKGQYEAEMMPRFSRHQ